MEDDLTPNDIPSQLTVISKEELSEQMEKEGDAMEEALLASMAVTNGDELAGDPMALKQPTNAKENGSPPGVALSEEPPTSSEA